MPRLSFTHHNTAIERFSANGHHDIAPNTLENFASRENKAVCMWVGVFAAGEAEMFVVRDLLDSVGFAGGAGFVAFDVMALEEDTVHWYNFTRFQQSDVTNDDFLLMVQYNEHICRCDDHKP